MNIHWWIYVVAIVSLFASCLIINFVVKKINEVRLEERFQRIQHKSISQSTQVQGRLPDMEKRNPKLQLSTDKQAKPTGISLVFNKHDNLLEDKRKKDLEDEFKKDMEKLSEKSLSQNEANVLPSKVFAIRISDTKVFGNQISTAKLLDDTLATKVENNATKSNEICFNTKLQEVKLSNNKVTIINKQIVETARSEVTDSSTDPSLQVDEQALKSLSLADSTVGANKPLYLGAIYNEVRLNAKSTKDENSLTGKEIFEYLPPEMVEVNVSEHESTPSIEKITMAPSYNNIKQWIKRSLVFKASNQSLNSHS